MATNTKIVTEDILEILDFKILTSAAHSQLDVSQGESYASVLAKIAARSPTFLEKEGLDAALNPSATNPFVTSMDLTIDLSGSIPWKTIGNEGSNADFEGSTEQVFLDAFTSMPDFIWFYVKPGTYAFSNPLTLPDGIRLIGSVTSQTILISTSTTVILGQDTFIGFLTIIGLPAIDASFSSNIEVNNCILSTNGTTVVMANNATRFNLVECAILLGDLVGSNITDAKFSGLYIDAAGSHGIHLHSVNSLILWGSFFKSGTPRFELSSNLRIVGNHFNNGIDNVSPVTSILLRANTPSTNNNEDETLNHLLSYLGSSSIAQDTPSYSSNFAGMPAQDLTARASAIDLLLQWIYEERNFSLVAESEPMYVRWNPATATLTTTGNMRLISAHRDAIWLLPVLNVVIPNNYFLYYVLDRTLHTTNITLTPRLAILGSLPIDINPPSGSAENRQFWILAYNMSGTLWWRGGGGSRFPNTNNELGEYFVDGKSNSLIKYIGANDYNDSHPNYSDNFAGSQGEDLVTRLGKQDTLIRRLFEHANLTYYISTNGYISSDAVGELTLTGVLTFKLPHTSGTTTIANTAWSIPDGSLLYLTWDAVALGAATATVATVLPHPNAYPLTTKYFLVAIRIGSIFYLWNGTRLPMSGSRWPLPSMARSVVPTSTADSLFNTYGNTVHNTVWVDVSGTRHFLWENLSLLTATGTLLSRNSLANQLTPTSGLTNLGDGEALRITHTWNPGSAKNVTIEKVTLPLTQYLEQNQFLWVQNRSGYLFFMGEG